MKFYSSSELIDQQIKNSLRLAGIEGLDKGREILMNSPLITIPLSELDSQYSINDLSSDPNMRKNVIDLAEAIRRGDPLPPIVVDSNGNYIWDGNHRFLAAYLCGLSSVLVLYVNDWRSRASELAHKSAIDN